MDSINTGKCCSIHVLSTLAVNGSGGCAILPFCCNNIDSFLAAINTGDITFEWSTENQM